ncbi:hypothetical protein RSA31_22185 [Pantoea dispersa]|nr:hypothetical protein RSA31_22185 [Pantoea dispersa]
MVDAESRKGGPRAALFAWSIGSDQFADLLAGLSAAALSPGALSPDGAAGAGVVFSVDLLPFGRSSAIFSALSSLASGGT